MASFHINHHCFGMVLSSQTPATSHSAVPFLPPILSINTFQKALLIESLIVDLDTGSEHPYHTPLHRVVSDNNSVCV
jgi:hypothetical protein